MDLSLGISEINALLSGLAPLRRNRIRFILASGTVVLAFLLTAFAQWAFGSTAATTFALVVIVSTSLLGLTAGLCAVAVAMVTLDFFFVPPILEFDAHGLVRVGLVMGALSGCTHLIERRLSASIRSKIKPPIGIKGTLDGIQNGELYGWAFDADHPAEPVEVTVLVNKHPVAHVAAVHYRPDVAETMTCSGRHGFYVDLAKYFPVDTEAVIDVRLANGAPLENAPSRVRVPAIEPRRQRPTVLFMHIPKTAGTAFREAMAANFLQSEIAYLYPTPPGFLVTDLRALPLEQRRAYRIVMGHYQFGMHEALPQESEYITIVREPSARVLSQYAYYLQKQDDVVQSKKNQVMKLEELFENRLTVDLDNALVRCFSGVDERDFPPGSLTSAVYEQALYNLRTAFTFVGHQEASSQAFRWLRNHYGWHTTEELPIVNLGSVRLAEQADESLAAVIRHFNEWDYFLYEEILRLFPAQLFTAEAPQRGLNAQHVAQE